MRLRSAQQGYLMIVAVALILIIGFIGVSVTALFNTSSRASIDHLLSGQAFYIAESGLEAAGFKLLTPTLASRTSCAAAGATNVAVGKGVYTITTTGPIYVTAATLNGALSATATTIPVSSTIGYASSGRIMIDRELINYIGISGNNFIGVMRNVDGTSAAAHDTGTQVGQYQCNLTSQGGVPTLTAPANAGNPYGKRVLKEGMQLQEAWAAGNLNTGKFTVLRWNRPTEVQWIDASVTSKDREHLNSISMVSYADGWAVGEKGEFIHWNGSTWTPVTAEPRIDYFGVYCFASNSCKAVGNSSGSTTTLNNWNGATWTRIIPTGVTARTHLRSVHCSADNNCWAVGSDAGGGRFYQWNGSTWTGFNVNTLTGFGSSDFFNGVFCNSSTDCWAVGGNATFARKTTGSWTNFATGLPSAIYRGIYCNSSTDCWAVGDANGSQDLFVHWNGTVWSRNASTPTPLANLASVACTNSRDCWAVGVTTVGTNPVFGHWNGTSWSQFTPDGTMPAVALNSVAMVGPHTQPQSNWTETIP